MPQYNLATPEEQIVVSWLFEPFGYLDSQVNTDGVSARAALTADPALDVTQWTRNNTPGADVDLEGWTGCAMVWWIWKNDQVNVTPPSRPPETPDWIALLTQWDASLSTGAIQRAVDAGVQHTIVREDGTTLTQPTGQNRQHQKNMVGKVLGVLQ